MIVDDGLGCIVAFVALSLAIVALFIFVYRRSVPEVRVRAARLHSALGRLSHRPGDQAALEEIVSAVSNGQWLLRDDVSTQSDLWRRAVGFAFANVATTDGQRVLTQLVVPLSSSSIFNAGDFLSKTVEAVRLNPDRRVVHDVLRNAVRAIPRIRIGLNQGEWFYQQLLELVKQQPNNPDVAVFALDMGRWHCSRMRPEGQVTVYDEQMIQNDIAVRRAGS